MLNCILIKSYKRLSDLSKTYIVYNLDYAIYKTWHNYINTRIGYYNIYLSYISLIMILPQYPPKLCFITMFKHI